MAVQQFQAHEANLGTHKSLKKNNKTAMTMRRIIICIFVNLTCHVRLIS